MEDVGKMLNVTLHRNLCYHGSLSERKHVSHASGTVLGLLSLYSLNLVFLHVIICHWNKYTFTCYGVILVFFNLEPIFPGVGV